MEQINNAVLEMLRRTSTNLSSDSSSKLSAQTKKDTFGMLVKLAEQKNSDIENESVSNQTESGTRETTDQKTSEPTEKANETTETSEKPEQEETEVCDAAREAACAQIVWIVPQDETETVAVSTNAIEGVTEDGETVVVPEMSGGEETAVLSDELPLGETNEFAGTASVSVETETPELPSEQRTADTPETPVDTWQTVETETPVVHEEAAETEIAEQSEIVQEDTPDVRLDDNEETNGEAVVETAVFKDVETAPIKVAEAPAQTEEVELQEQVSDQLVKVLESGEDRVEIQLQPEALGMLTVSLTRGTDGTLSVVLHAENAQTRSLLEKSMGSLQELLVDRGQQSVQVAVEHNEETQRQQNQQQQQDLQDGSSGNQRQQRRHQESSSEDFLQQLRLGLIDFNDEE